jgi:hypothetical protein
LASLNRCSPSGQSGKRSLLPPTGSSSRAGRQALAMPAWSVGSREPCQARTEAAGEVCHGRQPGSSQLTRRGFVRYVVACRARHYRCRAERTFWAYPVSCVSACDRTAIPLSVANRLALFQGCGVRDNWILSVLPAGDCGLAWCCSPGTVIVPPSGFIFRAGDGHLSRHPAWVSCASSWRCRSSAAGGGV